MNLRWRERDESFLPAHWQATVLLDLVMNTNLSSHRLLGSTGIFYEDLLQRDYLLSPEKFYRLIHKCVKHYRGNDLSFRFGQRLFPGFYGAFSEALTASENLGTALELLGNFGARISPLLVPKITIQNNYAEVRWYSALGNKEFHRFLCEAYLSGFAHAIRGLSTSKTAWQFEFEHPTPSESENYEVHFGENVRFERPVTRMVVPGEMLQHRFHTASELIYARAVSDLQPKKAIPVGFVLFLREQLHTQLRLCPSLDSLAQQLGCSGATLKRKLRKHGCSFRELLDSVRMEVAVDLVEREGYSNGQIARYLGFYDEANYRRSFKRCTGLNPSEYSYL